MKQSTVTQMSSTDMGLFSIAGFLKKISGDTIEGNQILDNIKVNFDKVTSFVSSSVSSILFKQSVSHILQAKNNTLLISLNYFALSINNKLDKILDSMGLKSGNSVAPSVASYDIFQTMSDNIQTIKDILFDKFRIVRSLEINSEDTKAKNLLYEGINKISNVATNLLTNSGLTQNINQINEGIRLGINGTNELLKNVITLLQDIFLYLPELSVNGQNEKAKSRKNEFLALAKALQGFSKLLTDSFLEAFATFVETYEKFVSTENTKKLMLTSANLLAFSTTLRIVGFLINSVKRAFFGLTLSIGILSIMLLMPPFQLGMLALVGFLFTISKVLGGTRKGFGLTLSVRRLGLGLIMLVGAMFLMGKLKFGAIFKMLFFLSGLALVLKLFDKKNNGAVSITKNISRSNKFEVKGLFGLAIGLSILILSIDLVSGINWSSAGALLFFIAGLGLTIAGLNKINKRGVSPFSDMFSLGIGLSLLIVVLSLVGEISFSGLAKLISFILGLGLAIALSSFLMNKFGGGSKARIPGVNIGFKAGGSGMFGFALGLAVLVLTIAAVGELDWIPALKLLGFIVLLGFAVGVPSMVTKGSKPSGLFSFSLGVAILVLTIAATSELDWKPAWYLLGFITGIGLVTRVLDQEKIGLLRSIAITIVVLAGSLWVLSKVNMTYEKILTIGLTLGMLLGVIFIASKMKVAIITGSIMLLIVASVSLVIATSLWMIGKISPDPIKMLYFIGAIVLLSLTFIVLQPLLGLAIIGAGLALVLGLSALLIAAPLMMIQNLSFENVGAFLLAIAGLAIGLFLLLPQLIIAVVSGALLMVIGVSVLVFAGALMAIMELEINPRKIQGFNEGLVSLMEAFNSFSVFDIGKAALKSIALIPVIAVTLLASIVFAAIEKLNLSETKIGAFGVFLGNFIRMTTNEIGNSVGALKKAKPGLEALSKLVNTGSDLAKLIVAFSNMNYNEYGIKDGKLQIISVRKITDAEIAQVGINVGKLVQGLLNPLMVMSGDGEYWNFGNGMKVKNIFKGGLFGDKNSGVNRMKKISDAFKPLVEGIANFASLGIAQDPKALETFKVGISDSISVLSNVFEKLEKWKNKNAPESISNINELIKTFEGLDAFKSMSDSMDKLLNSLADEDKWGKINKNLGTLNENFKSIVKNINSIDIKKALALENNLKLMTERESSENLKLVVEQMKEMIGMITESNQNSQPQIIQTYSGTQTVAPEKNNENNAIWEDIKNLMIDINEKIAGTNSKLSGKLKVAIINGNDSNLVGGN